MESTLPSFTCFSFRTSAAFFFMDESRDVSSPSFNEWFKHRPRFSSLHFLLSRSPFAPSSSILSQVCDKLKQPNTQILPFVQNKAFPLSVFRNSLAISKSFWISYLVHPSTHLKISSLLIDDICCASLHLAYRPSVTNHGALGLAFHRKSKEEPFPLFAFSHRHCLKSIDFLCFDPAWDSTALGTLWSQKCALHRCCYVF